MAQLQARYRRVVDVCFERGGGQRIYVKSAAKFRQCVGPALNLFSGGQSSGAERMDGIRHYPTMSVTRDQIILVRSQFSERSLERSLRACPSRNVLRVSTARSSD